MQFPPPWAPHTYDFFILTSLTHPRKILLIVLELGKAKDLSAPLRNLRHHKDIPGEWIHGNQEETCPGPSSEHGTSRTRNRNTTQHTATVPYKYWPWNILCFHGAKYDEGFYRPCLEIQGGNRMSLWQEKTLICVNTKCPDCLQATHCPAFRNPPMNKQWGTFYKIRVCSYVTLHTHVWD
jgi:hypothetical protein